MRKILLLLFTIGFTFSYSQQSISSFEFNLDKNASLFSLKNPNNENFLIIVSEQEKLNFKLFDNQTIKIKEFDIQVPEGKGKSILGYNFYDDETVHFYWSKRGFEGLVKQVINLTTQKSSIQDIEFNIKDEKFIVRLSTDNNFYIITCLEEENVINTYSFDEKLVKTTYDLKDEKFISSLNRRATLKDIFIEENWSKTDFLTQVIKEETPPSLVLSRDKRKCFVDKDRLIFTFDNNHDFTQCIQLDLKSNNYKVNHIKKPFIKKSDFNNIESNSFYYKNSIVQMKLVGHLMNISFKDFEGNELKNYIIEDNIDISFKNTDIIQEDGDILDKRILGKSNQLLRKIGNNFPSIVLNDYNQNTLMIIGGVSEVRQKSGIFYGGIIGGFTGAMIGSLLQDYNLNNINSYNNRKVIYINCLLDSNFNNIEGNINETAFDKLRFFIHKNKDITHQTIIKNKKSIILGGFNKKDKTFTFYEFIN
ncbi:hypothetical protein [Flavobacterium okayamense]|uniref:Uncharacterized protein n=1 Tax=Flavobacterium okayamense TaxID=2830782 RepID=A0ABM7SAQ8_9FLAO|nr:hypothetical protein [Flavobacterium okayamense]BCY27942.1 hypothetical protein KK2020170_08100 [Flavobacterium okayamense]